MTLNKSYIQQEQNFFPLFETMQEEKGTASNFWSDNMDYMDFTKRNLDLEE